MKIRVLHRLLAAALVGLFSLPAIAQYTRDASANQKIDEAINSHYLMMDLDKAEGLLTGTIAACEDKCTPQTKAKAWMYVGIVRGSGRSDQAGAAEAFSNAKGIDPSIQLDADLASPETKQTWQQATGSAPAAAPAPTPAPAPVAATPAVAAPGAAPPPEGVPGDMICSPQGAPIGVNMPIPFSCTSDAKITEGFIKFLEPGGTDWKKIELADGGDGQWQAEVPCEYTKTAGELKFYVGVKDASGEYVDQFGSKKEPAPLFIEEGGAAPAYPGQAPVSACTEGAGGAEPASDCPPDFPGCNDGDQQCGDKDWGVACKNSSECKCGLLCDGGQCTTAPSCTSDADCSTGSCVDGACSAGPEKKASGPFKRHWLNLSAGLDMMWFGGGDNLCALAEGFQDSYGVYCYQGENSGDFGDVNTGGGFAAGQLRLKLGYDFAIIDRLTVGARVGFAFLNSRPTTDANGAFLPVHVEGRVTYNITSLSNAGFRPAVYVAGGLAESNGRLRAQNDIDVFKIGGQVFAAPGVNLGYAIAPNMVVNLDTQAMLMFPTGGMAVVLHPALNFTYGL